VTNSPTNIRLGPCRVRWAGKDVGLTKGGVDVTLKTDTKMIQVDQFGNTPLDEYILGRTLTVKCPFAESDVSSVYSYLKQSQANLVDNGVVATGLVTFTAVPAVADTLTVNGHVFSFIAAASTVVGVDQVVIGATVPATIVNLVLTLNMSSDPNVIAGVYTANASTMGIAYYASGVAGNSFTLAKSSTGISTITATLTGGTNPTSKRVEVLTGIGQSLRAQAQILTLHPQNRVDNDSSEDFTVPIASTNGGFQFKYELNTERVFNIEFTGYPDPITTRLFMYGNPV
jgi:hypothetical protein